MGVADPAAMIANIFARLVCIVEDGTRPALLLICIGDFRVGACRCVPPKLALVLRCHDVVSAAPSFCVSYVS